MKNILIIKHGALGDFMMATGPFAAIRNHHKNDRIILITTTPFENLARTSNYFNNVWIDNRPPAWKFWQWNKLRTKIKNQNFDMVYDLQTSSRTSKYFQMLNPTPPNWNGIAPGCSHPHTNPDRTKMHTIERQRDQLATAGITNVPMPDLSWLKNDITDFNLPNKFALLIPGAAPHRTEKKWPAQKYGELANHLVDQNITPVILGTASESHDAQTIQQICPDAISLIGKTDFGHIAELARAATLCVGNDTGPTHLISLCDCPSFVLFSGHSNPDLTRPRGKNVTIIQKPSLADLPLAELLANIAPDQKAKTNATG